MKRKRYSEEKIISIPKEHEASASAADLSRRHGVAENSIYRWKAKFGGMEVSDACWVKQSSTRRRLRSSSRENGNGLAATPGRGTPQESSRE